MLLDGKYDDGDVVSTGDAPTKAWCIGVGICLFPLYLLVSAFGNRGKASAAICFAGAMITIIRLHRNLFRQVWFWVLMVFFAAVHTAPVLFIPWPNKDYSFAVIFPLGVLDAFACSFLLQAISKKMKPPEKTNLTL